MTALTSLEEVARAYEIVDVVPNDGDPFLIVSRKPKLAEQQMELFEASTSAPTGEIGSTSPSPFTSWIRREYNPQLLGYRGLRIYDQMRRSDGIVRASLRIIKTPVLAARWFTAPADAKRARDKKSADFIWWNLTEGMSISWAQFITEALLMCDFGYYMFEKVWENRDVDGVKRTVLKKLAPRHPMDVKEWHFDANGGPAGVTMYVATEGFVGGQIEKYIPIDKLLVFTFDKEAGNIEGISVLRSAYKHWYYKEQLYKIDAIQKERHGIGIPVIVLPPGYKETDKMAADQLGRNLRTNDRAHVVLPPNWELTFAELKGQPVDALKSVDHHDAAIRENVLAGFLGARATTKDEDQTMFLKATRFIAEIICDTINHHLIPQMMQFNFPPTYDQPFLKARRIGEAADWRTMSFALRNLIGAGVIVPDDPLEDLLREEMDLTPRDPNTERIVPTPQNKDTPAGATAPGQNVPQTVQQPGQQPPSASGRQKPGQPGLPRQQTKPPVGLPRGNAGTDRSGG